MNGGFTTPGLLASVVETVTPPPLALLPARPIRVTLPVSSPDPLPVGSPAPIATTSTAPPAVRRVAVVVPCFNRPQDAAALLADLARIDRTWSLASPARVAAAAIDLRVLLVDNASASPLSTLAIPTGLHVEHLRLSTNTGGSGGFNAGMRRVLALDEENDAALAWRAWGGGGGGGSGGASAAPAADNARAANRSAAAGPDLVWLVDSDARVAPDTLRTLLEVLESDPGIVAAGSAICDPVTGQAFELGGHVNRKIGHYEPMVIGNVGVRTLVDADYLAACCALVRADAIRDTGVFPDRFLNGDDVEWFIRMKAMTGGRVVGVPWSLAMHPRFDRFPTWPRYYMTRNAFGPLDAVGGGAALRLSRALREVPRAIQQDMLGRRDLARLHMAGLRHAARHRTIGPAPDGLIQIDTPLPFSALSQTLLGLLGMARPRPTSGRVLPRLLLSDSHRRELDDQLIRAGIVVRRAPNPRPAGLFRASIGAVRRLFFGPDVDVAVVPARGRPDAWFLGRIMIEVSPQGFLLRRTPRTRTLARSGGTALAGVWHSVRIARRGHEPIEPQRSGLLGSHTPSADERADLAHRVRHNIRGLSLCAVVLSYNRRAALENTLGRLGQSGLFAVDADSAEAPFSALVVDNDSSDGSAEMVNERFPGARLLRTGGNLGVEAFNRAVELVDADIVLILDDDAVPEPQAVRRAMELLARRPDLAAVTLHPKHPGRARAGAAAQDPGASEWSFAAALRGSTTDRCPVMGCANLVRRDAWRRAGGYEESFFLYRNDTDLALKLLGLGYGVHFNPAWVVWHDSPGGAGGRKSRRWHRTATRNWLWMARRHGRGFSRPLGALLGWAWAHKLAGFSFGRHAATFRGVYDGLFSKRPRLPEGVRRDGRAWRELIALMLMR